jgi:hypothetical protein
MRSLWCGGIFGFSPRLAIDPIIAHSPFDTLSWIFIPRPYSGQPLPDPMNPAMKLFTCLRKYKGDLVWSNWRYHEIDNVVM